MPFNPNLSARQSILVQAESHRVWSALTDPTTIRKYLYGADTITDWKVGSAIVFRGEFQGQAWEDHGVIQDHVPGRRLSFTYWSGACGLEDRPENYGLVTYELVPTAEGTQLTVTQQGYASAESQQNSSQGWAAILSEVKRLVEDPSR